MFDFPRIGNLAANALARKKLRTGSPRGRSEEGIWQQKRRIGIHHCDVCLPAYLFLQDVSDEDSAS